MSENVMEQAEQGMERYFFRASARDFEKIPNNPIAYWVSSRLRSNFNKLEAFASNFEIKAGISTGKNDSFIFLWPEVSANFINIKNSSSYKYTAHNKGGEFRKWFGNCDFVLKYSISDIAAMERNPGFRHDGKEFYFIPHVGWSKITSGKSSFRSYGSGFTFDSAGLAIFSDQQNDFNSALGFLNSKVCVELLKILNPTLNVTPKIIKLLPLFRAKYNLDELIINLINIAQDDWNSYETSWNFKNSPLVHFDANNLLLATNYERLRLDWGTATTEMRHLEEENNRIFIEAYRLQDELTPKVPLEEITLTCNPHYRYGGNKTDEEREVLLLQDTMAEFCSYAVGCMFGRYSLDKPGLVLANQGDTLQDYLQQVPQPRFMPDDDNVIPLLDADWFADDVTGRFLDFLRVTFGTEHYAENLAFVERGLNIKNKRNYSIRDFFVKEFYDYHVRMYKKRPIYWLFASPKGTFQALVYLHRYRPDTVSVVLRYLREFRDKLAARRQLVEQRLTDASASQGEKTRLTKEQEQLRKQILELDDYEHDVLFPLAGQRLEIDLDDGVKANYPRFGKALKKVAGLS